MTYNQMPDNRPPRRYGTGRGWGLGLLVFIIAVMIIGWGWGYGYGGFGGWGGWGRDNVAMHHAENNRAVANIPRGPSNASGATTKTQ